MLSENVVEVDRKKIKSVNNMQRSLTLIDIPSFLCLAGYYCRFNEGFFFIAAPLMDLTKKKAKFEWYETYEKSLQDPKDRLISTKFERCR